jgi:hypothetical protein
MFMKFLPKLAFIGLAVAALAIVADAQKVRYNYLPGTDFSRFKTYKWVEIKGANYPNQLVDNQIRQSIDRQLGSKGLQRTDNDFADLYVGYQAAVSQEQQWNAYSTGGDYWGYGGWGGWGGMSSTTMTSSTLNIGTLNLDVYDVATKKQVWRGEATKTLGNPKTPEKLQANIDKAMAKLLKNYPPPAK